MPKTPRKPPPFRTIAEYLRRATIEPNLLNTPFTHEERRIVAYMEWLKGRLGRAADDMDLGHPVSVIIPAHDAAGTIGRALMSVVAQTHARLEIIVIDDASSDGTADAARRVSDDRIRVVEMPEGVGQAGARMIGMHEASSPFVCHLDADDWWDPRFVAVSLHQAVTRDAGFVYSAQRILRSVERSGGGVRQETIRFAPFNRSLLENTNYISMISVLHDHTLGLETGFDISLSRLVDWDFFLRLSEAAPPHAIPVILSTYDQGRVGSVGEAEARAPNLQRVRDKLERPRLTDLGLTVPPGLPADVRELVEGAFLRPASPPPPSRRRASIVIPSFEAPEYLDLCLRALRAFDDPLADEVVVVDNASSDPVPRVLADHGDWAKLRVIWSDTNRGFTWAANRGIEEAVPGNDVVLLNNDALVTPGWLAELCAVADRHADAGIVASRQVLFSGTKTIRAHVPAADPRFECDTNLSHVHDSVRDPYFGEGLVELSYAPLFCALITRQAIEAVGPLDTERSPHYQSDWLYCDAVRSFAGLRILYTARATVYHFLSRSSRELRRDDPDLFERMVGRNEPPVAARTTTGVPSDDDG